MSQLKRTTRNRGLAALIGAVAVLGVGFFVLSTATSQAAESCQGLNTALRNNQNFIAGQMRNPDALSADRIQNRLAVVALIEDRRLAAGCKGGAGKQKGNQGGSGESCLGLDTALRNNQNFVANQRSNPDAQSAARIQNRLKVIELIEDRRLAAGCKDAKKPAAEDPPAEDPAAEDPADAPVAQPPAAKPGNGNNNGGNGRNNNSGAGEVVCQGDTVTFSGGGGSGLEASSGQFPVGTKMRVTNLANNKSVEVTVTSVSGSCVLLNTAAMDRIRQGPQNNLIRQARIERLN